MAALMMVVTEGRDGWWIGLGLMERSKKKII